MRNLNHFSLFYNFLDIQDINIGIFNQKNGRPSFTCVPILHIKLIVHKLLIIFYYYLVLLFML